MSTTAENIHKQISDNPILIYMKGTPQLPQCGFSAQTVQALMACGERFAFVNVLDNPDIRSELPKVANWPTFPQLWVEGELVGGCDIVVEMHQEGELEPLVKQAAARAQANEGSDQPDA
ncbi:MAG TPA: Grx4 family monothiol glutaredoxin [Halomonas sp.]|nr:Grx4 family monothiol glutaredoxin [Halomonas sp.]